MPALIVDPALIAAVTRQFNLRGELKPFNLTENVVPIFDIGTLTGARAPTVVTTLQDSQGVRVGTTGGDTPLSVMPPLIDDGDVSDGDPVTNPTAGTVIRTSGQLTGVSHWLWAEVSADVLTEARLVWRNAADTADIATWTVLLVPAGASKHRWGPWVVSVNTDERFNIIPVASITGDMTGNLTLSPASPSTAS